LAEVKQRHLNHPGAVWHAWRRAVKPPAPRRQQARAAQPKASGYGRPIYFGQDEIRRGAAAMRESMSSDWHRLARICLEAALVSVVCQNWLGKSPHSSPKKIKAVEIALDGPCPCGPHAMPCHSEVDARFRWPL
jgi:hypothetical protein